MKLRTLVILGVTGLLAGWSMTHAQAHMSAITYEEFLTKHALEPSTHARDEPVLLGTASKQVPLNAWKYQHILGRHLDESGHEDWMSAIASQMMQEATWRCDLSSRFADGCAQFTKSTARWAGNSFCRDLGKVRVEDPEWAYACAVRYVVWLYDRLPQIDNECARLTAALRAYNGGLKWIQREIKLAKKLGLDHNDAQVLIGLSLRAKWAEKENDRYAVKILNHWQPYYIDAKYGGKLMCGGSV